MTRLRLNTAWLALSVGLGAGMALAEADPAGNGIGYCDPDPELRSFPCRGANNAVVTTDQELMTIGAGIASDQMRTMRPKDGETGPRLPAATQRQQTPEAEVETPETPDTADADKTRELTEEERAERRAERERKRAEKARKQQEKADKDRRRQQEADRLAEEDRKQRQEAERLAEEDRRQAEKADRAALREQRRIEEERAARRAAKRAERRAERAAAAAAREADAQADEVQEEVVSEDGVRRSNEEFDTSVASSGRTTVTPPQADRGGLSDLEKALLFGLGALTVGNILDNGDEVVANSGDRVVVRRDGDLAVLKNDDTLLRRPGDTVRTERFSDGSTRTTVTRPNGEKVITIRAADGTTLRRSRVMPDGREYVLFDDTRDIAAVDLDRLPASARAGDPARDATAARSDDTALRRALQAEMAANAGRRFSLDQIRSIAPVRWLAPEVEVEAITFATGSAAIRPDQARELAELGQALRQMLESRPDTVLLIEGHTDAVGDPGYNLALSDRRAESVALALTEYFDIPPENMVIQGYGEEFLKVPTLDAEPANRRAAVRNITPLLN